MGSKQACPYTLSSELSLVLSLEIGKILLGFIFVFLFYTRLVRPLITWMTTSVEVVPEEAADPEIMETEEGFQGEGQSLAEIGSEAQEIRDTVHQFVEKDPEFAASIVRKWMRERS